MSLINDALKKAQRQRGDEPASEIAAAPAAGRVPRREKPPGFQTLLVRAAVGVIAVCAVIVTTVLLLRDDAPTQVATNPTPPKSESTANNPAPAPKPDSAGPIAEPIAPKVAPDPVPDVSLPSSDPALAPANTPAVTAPANPATTAPAVAANPGGPNLTLPPVGEPSPPIPAPATTVEQDKRILAYLSTLRVTGIRPSGADSKVLMNDRVYRLGDVVDYGLGLKLTGVAVQRLDFVDERGVAYVKTF